MRVWVEGPDEGSQQQAGGPAPERKLKVTLRFREVLWPAGTPEVTWSQISSLHDIFSDRSRRFPINRGGGKLRNFIFFGNFFFFAIFKGAGRGEGRKGTPKPEAQVARLFFKGLYFIPHQIYWFITKF